MKSEIIQKEKTSLEPNHKQFIFIDDGTQNTYGGEIQFRARFEKAVAGESFSLQSTTVHHRRSSRDYSNNGRDRTFSSKTTTEQ